MLRLTFATIALLWSASSFAQSSNFDLLRRSIHKYDFDGIQRLLPDLLKSGTLNVNYRPPFFLEDTGEGDLTMLQDGALSRWHIETIKLLLDNGASLSAVSPDGETALHYAVEGGDPDIVKLLVTRGAKINVESNVGTPLGLAYIIDSTQWPHLREGEIIRFLIVSGAKIGDRQRRRIKEDSALLKVALKKQAVESSAKLSQMKKEAKLSHKEGWRAIWKRFAADPIMQTHATPFLDPPAKVFSWKIEIQGIPQEAFYQLTGYLEGDRDYPVDINFVGVGHTGRFGEYDFRNIWHPDLYDVIMVTGEIIGRVDGIQPDGTTNGYGNMVVRATEKLIDLGPK